MKQKSPDFNSLKQSHNVDSSNLLIIILGWIVIAILVNPLGDFPLNDDWAYAESVKYLLETGNFQLPGWAVANLLPQVLWGALFCLPFGFSFTALRFSTLILGLLGIIATYLLFKEISSNKKIALFCALLIAINPIYLALSYTFMTDVPHFTLSVISLYFFYLGLKKDSLKNIIIALLFALIALLIRQVTAALFMGYAMAYVLKYRGKINYLGISALLFIGLPIVVQSAFSKIFWPKDFGNYGVKEEKFVAQMTTVDTSLISNFIYFGLCALLYLGCFLLPFLILAFLLKCDRIKSSFSRNLFIASFFFLATAIASWLISNNQMMPIKGNVIESWGLGPLTLRDTLLLSPKPLPNNFQLFWTIVTVLSVIGAALLLQFLILSIGQLFLDQKISWTKRSLIFVNGSIGVIYFLPLGMSFFFDRYLLFFLPLLVVMIFHFIGDVNYSKLSFKNSLFSILMTVALGVLTISATHDYLSWNRIRWQAIETLRQEKAVSPNQIDGGFEFNAWHLYDPEYSERKKRKNGEAWWWVEQDNYLISFSPVEGYEITNKYPLKNWLPFRSEYILVSQKKNEVTTN